ncbi:hypothetical protein GCM10010472_08170 [Pseudonocardia halophobica]|uniref:Uncharacterized protein n=1 Tax=Pseudonocardia halophobica TaxID=29401 RepID=A0A9W6L4W8_9PSEU|nr:hypothetical protein [Pseudonocardia halophobica]GLL13042.1 hypothetical protein GCM10017577_41850 [Pseudonocardia halophobica]
MADPTWLGTISALSGTVLGGVIAAAAQSVRDRRTRRYQSEARWEKAFVDGVAEFLSASDAEFRALRRLHQASPGDERWHGLRNDADDAVEEAERKSNVVSLLSGERTHPVRVASRSMREALRELQAAAHDGSVLSENEVDDVRRRWTAAREDLLRLVQGIYVSHGRHPRVRALHERLGSARTRSSGPGRRE